MSEIANYFKKVFTDPKSMFFVAIGVMLLIVAGIAITDVNDCTALKQEVIDRVKAVNYAIIVIGFLFVGVGIARTSKHSFIVDYIEVICGILGVSVFICGLLFLTTANDIICPTTTITSCAHAQWATGLIIMLGSVYFWYNKNKGSDDETDSDDGHKDKGGGAKKPKMKSSRDEIQEIQGRIEEYEEKRRKAEADDDSALAETLDERLFELKKEKNSIVLRERNKKERREEELAAQEAQILAPKKDPKASKPAAQAARQPFQLPFAAQEN